MAHDPYLNARYGTNLYPEPSHSVGLGIQSDGFDHTRPAYFHEEVHRSQTNSPYLTNNLPASPQSNGSSGARRIRSGRSITRSSTPHSNRVDKPSPKSKKKSSAKNKTPQISQPLSILTKHMAGVPVRDMAAWVNRPAEERQREAAKRNGYVTRPMNSFMLYRSAYAERTKAWCAENNHQVVSSVSGESWPLEPAEVREFYNDLAKIERTNHQNAHPDYKFSPSKPGYAGSKKRKGAELSDEESLLDDDPDGDWAASHGIRMRPAKRFGRDAGYPAGNAPTGHYPPRRPPQSYETSSNFDEGAYRSSWETNNIGRPLPVAMDDQRLYQNQYYRSHFEPVPYPYMGQSLVENVRYAPVEMPEPPSHTSLFAAPGQSNFELHDFDAQPSSVLGQEAHIDPTLFGYDAQNAGLDSTLGGGLDFSGQSHHFERGYDCGAAAAPEQSAAADPGYSSGQWADHINPFFEQPNEFDPLFAEQPPNSATSRKKSVASGKGSKPKSGGRVEQLVSPNGRT